MPPPPNAFTLMLQQNIQKSCTDSHTDVTDHHGHHNYCDVTLQIFGAHSTLLKVVMNLMIPQCL